MKFSYFILFILSLSTINAQAQEEKVFFHRNSVYVELLGNGGYYSVNYDYLITPKNALKLSARAGISIHPERGTGPTIPLEVNLLFGNPNKRKKKGFLEIGTGYTWVRHFSNDIKFNYRINRIGYRRQSPYGGFMYRIALITWTEVFTNAPELGDPTFLVLPTISIGHAF
jgi:hypothetical protein